MTLPPTLWAARVTTSPKTVSCLINEATSPGGIRGREGGKERERNTKRKREGRIVCRLERMRKWYTQNPCRCSQEGGLETDKVFIWSDQGTHARAGGIRPSGPATQGKWYDTVAWRRQSLRSIRASDRNSYFYKHLLFHNEPLALSYQLISHSGTFIEQMTCTRFRQSKNYNRLIPCPHGADDLV